MFDNMRGVHGRCPPFLVGGLLVLCFILAFNWWSLSAQNNELLRQVEELSDQLKISSEGQDMCVHQRVSAEARIKNLEDDTAQLQVRLEQLRADNDEANKRLLQKDSERQDVAKERDSVQRAADACATELDSLNKLDVSKDATIASLRLEKDAFVSQLEKRNKEISKLKSELEAAQSELGNLKPRVALKSSQTPVLKSSPVPHGLRPWDLKPVDVGVVRVRPAGLRGMMFHNMHILPRDPPDAFRPKPRFSVTYLTQAPSGVVPAPAPKPDNIGVAVGGDHESLNQDANNVENENNAAEEDGKL
ncbi:protein GOLM2-like isoform X2 [Bacillus rossius redtenbacheri]|uniref:protein GOLM2-like isoform X2 n=1 Tax=Bacillus rossius redtenbacheri TaxID=93214 RepID=UPI002FDD0663